MMAVQLALSCANVIIGCTGVWLTGQGVMVGVTEVPSKHGQPKNGGGAPAARVEGTRSTSSCALFPTSPMITSPLVGSNEKR